MFKYDSHVAPKRSLLDKKKIREKIEGKLEENKIIFLEMLKRRKTLYVTFSFFTLENGEIMHLIYLIRLPFSFFQDP